MKLERVRVGPGLALTAMSALLVVWFVWHDSGSLSPGPLSAAHAQEPELEGSAGCVRCHGGAAEPIASACTSCHADVARDLAERSGLHGNLSTDATACASCHSEHHGAGHALAGGPAFALAGVADPARYDHAHVGRAHGGGLALGGRHLELACEDCHPNANVAVLPKGSKRFAGLEDACASCHSDPHAGKLPDCAACHGEERPFAEVARFAHPASFALSGSHSNLACGACHAEGSPHAVEAIGAAALEGRSTRTTRTCADCHASPHSAAFVAAAALERDAPERSQPSERDAGHAATHARGASCELCHSTADGAFSEPTVAMTPALHAATGFALEPPHAELACETCHALAEAPAGSRRSARPELERRAFSGLAVRSRARDGDDCEACHASPHGPQFDSGPFGGEGCLACHARHAFEPPAFGLAEHERTLFPLSGAHAAVACAQCHSGTIHWDVDGGARASGRDFGTTSRECSGCHADAHAGAFARSACSECHSTDSFAVASERFDHAVAGFALAGAHARAGCEACHAPRERADATGRTFGAIADRVEGDPRACASCHADAHHGFFDARVAAGALDSAACSACHTADAFSRVAGFDHARTGFALDGAHARATCASCHPPLAAPDPTGRTFARASVPVALALASCGACHADVHRGAFDRAGAPAIVDGARGCERCHTTESFDARRGGFDHALWTGFALEGTHAALDCSSCHAQGGGQRSAFARAPGTDCASCHADPHVGQFARGGRTECAQCHDARAPTFVATGFDHDRDARFALDATHAQLACSSCHVASPLPGGGSAVRYKPLGTSCGDCHAPGAQR